MSGQKTNRQEVHHSGKVGSLAQKRKKRLLRKLIKLVFWLVVLMLSAGLVFYGIYEWKIKPGRKFDYYSIESKIERADVAGAKYCQYGTSLLKYDRDGISVLDGKGTILWTAAYNMQNPAVSMAGDYVAVADIGAKQLYVYDAKGRAAEVEILSDILQISVSEQGEVAVLMQEEGANRIEIHDPYTAAGNKKVEILTYTKKDGYALAIALSKDGAKLVTSYFQVNGNQLDSKLTFYSFSGVGQGANADRIVGIFPYEDTLYAELYFLDNNTVCAVGDNRLEVFYMKQKPDILWEMEYQQKILSTRFSQDYIAVLWDAESGGEESLFSVYRKVGGKEAERKVSFQSTGIGIRGNDFFVYSEKNCLIMRPGGRVKFEGEFEENVQYMTAGKASDQFFLVTGQYIEEMILKEKAE